MLDVKRLRTLREIARRGSFAAAAKALGFSAAAVWQQMRAAERELGVQLFERTASGARLTGPGRVLLGHAEVALDRLDRAEAELAAIARGEGGQVTFGSFPTATEAFVADVMATFRREHPDVGLGFRDAEPYEQVIELEHLRCDCAVMFHLDGWPSAKDYDGVSVSDRDLVTYQPLFEDPYALALPAGHPLAAQTTVRLEQLADQVILGSAANCAPWGVALEALCHRQGFGPRFDAQFNTHDFHAVQALVAAGHGLSLLPRLALECTRRDVAIRPLEPAPVRHVKLGFPPVSYRSPACQALVATIEAVVRRRFGLARSPGAGT